MRRLILNNKRGQFFALYLVLLTLVMCGYVIFMYFKQADVVNSMVVSPIPLLEMQDNLVLIEMQEKNMICLAYKDNSNSASDIENAFLDRLIKNDDVKTFLLQYIIYKSSDGKTILGEQAIRATFLEDSKSEKSFFNLIYNFKLEGDILIVERVKLGKEFTLRPYTSNLEARSFPVDVSYEYEKTYNLNINDLIKEC